MDALAQVATADAETMEDLAVTEEERDHRPRVTRREGADLVTETMATLKVAEETMTKEEEEADAMAATETTGTTEDLTTTARDREETAREAEEEEEHVALAQDLALREAARLLQLASEHFSLETI